MEMLKRRWEGWARGASRRPIPRVERAIGSARRGRSSGQALVEFALVAPLFLLLIFGVVEYSLINASVGAFNFAAKDGARFGAIIGNGQAPNNTSDVDAYMVNYIILPHVVGLVFAQGTEIDIFRATEAGGCVLNTSGVCEEDIWQPANGVWGRISNTWTGTRNDQLSNADYLGVTIHYTYTYLTAFFAVTSPTINLTATSIQRIEPQQYGDRYDPRHKAWALISPAWSYLTGAIIDWKRRDAAPLTRLAGGYA